VLVEVVLSGAEGGGPAGAARLLSQVDEKRHPRTEAAANQLLDRYSGLVRPLASPKASTSSWRRFGLGC